MGKMQTVVTTFVDGLIHRHIHIYRQDITRYSSLSLCETWGNFVKSLYFANKCLYQSSNLKPPFAQM